MTNEKCSICGGERHLIKGETGIYCEFHFYETKEYAEMSEQTKQNFLMRMMSQSFSKHSDSAIAEAVPDITLTRDEAVHLFNMFRTRELTNLEQELFNRIRKFLEETP